MLTLNAAFKQVLGEALEPLGFVKIKTKHPYYVRAVTDEIINVVTIKEVWSGYPTEKRLINNSIGHTIMLLPKLH